MSLLITSLDELKAEITSNLLKKCVTNSETITCPVAELGAHTAPVVDLDLFTLRAETTRPPLPRARAIVWNLTCPNQTLTCSNCIL